MGRVATLLRRRWSAEQISGILRKTGELHISTETIYDDVTPFLVRISETQRQVVLCVVALLCLLYGALFLIVRHADGVIRRRYREREVAEEALREAHAMLERRVDERTAELAHANRDLEAEIAERRIADERIVHMARHDVLTGLPNRTLLTGVIVLFLQIDTVAPKNSNRDNHLQNRLFSGPRPSRAD